MRFILGALFILLQTKFWFGAGGFLTVQAINQQVLLQKEENNKLLNDNKKLKSEIKALKNYKISSPSLNIESSRIEDYARWKLGMVKKDEIFYYW